MGAESLEIRFLSLTSHSFGLNGFVRRSGIPKSELEIWATKPQIPSSCDICRLRVVPCYAFPNINPVQPFLVAQTFYGYGDRSWHLFVIRFRDVFITLG